MVELLQYPQRSWLPRLLPQPDVVELWSGCHACCCEGQQVWGFPQQRVESCPDAGCTGGTIPQCRHCHPHLSDSTRLGKLGTAAAKYHHHWLSGMEKDVMKNENVSICINFGISFLVISLTQNYVSGQNAFMHQCKRQMSKLTKCKKTQLCSHLSLSLVYLYDCLFNLLKLFKFQLH